MTRPARRPRVPLRVAVPAVLALVAAGSALSGCAESDGPVRARLSLVETLGGADTAGYERVLAPRAFVFPDDHGPHPGYRSEWWYLTANLAGPGGRELGLQLTFFRGALAPRTPELGSAWATNQAWMGHFALADGGTGDFRAAERFARGAVGLAGARAEPFRVWLDDWSLEGPVGVAARRRAEDAAASDLFPLRVRAGDGPLAVDLTVETLKPLVLQGQQGFSRKGEEAGNASYYYSFTRLRAEGTVVVGGETLAVEGGAWLDREWSTSALSSDQVGWDWFALRLSDGWDLMIYRLRRTDGSADPLSDGVLVDPEGRPSRLRWGDDVQIEETGRWSSPVDGASYPSGWRVRVPDRAIDVTVEPLLDDQELDLAFRYWEGAVRVTGAGVGGLPVEGRGFVELTGYAGAVRER